MNIFQRVGNWLKSLFSVTTIEKVFETPVAISDTMQDFQAICRSIVKGEAHWNEGTEGVPSLMLAGAIGAEVSRKVTTGLETEVTGGSRIVIGENGREIEEPLSNARSEYLNEQYQRIVKEQLRSAVKSACDDGEIIFKPYMATDGIENTIVTTDCYFPFEYNVRGELIDVAFGSVIYRDEYVYKLLERQSWDEQEQTHTIVYKAFKSKEVKKGINTDDVSEPIALSSVPEWADLPPDGLTIQNATQPLFVLFRLPSTDIIENPQLQGLPIFSKAIDQLQKADRQEARTDWEYDGGTLAVFAQRDLFKHDAEGRRIGVPKDKNRLFVELDGPGNIDADKKSMTVFNPAFRFDGLDARLNQIFRRIEFLSGVSYGIISDAGVQDKTATEIKASKDRFFTTVSDIQEALEKALKSLIVSMDMLADLQGIPQGEYDTRFTWDDSIAADREREYDERKQLVMMGVISPAEFRAWYLGIDVEVAQAELDAMPRAANEY